MRIVTAMGLRARLGEILDAASAGERIVIERDRRPMAVLIPYEEAARLDPDEQERRKRRVEALDRLIARGKWFRASGLMPADAPDAVTAIREERARDDV
ncbi:MAG: type II toxin-antitoxin system prevent-host-death family antitoxin [Chloroflexota bacterium]